MHLLLAILTIHSVGKNPMTSTRESIDRLSPRNRPDEKPIGYHRWRNLLFLHWSFPPSAIQDLLPSRLSIDTFRSRAWVGIVLFEMKGVRPWWSPSLPWISSFLETNVRTYVHFEGQNPGVWFFSLDATRALAVRIARSLWHLPYYRSQMNYHRKGDRVEYASQRLWPGKQGAGYRIVADANDWICSLDKDAKAGAAAEGTMEFFLAERYYLYSQSSQNKLFRAQVHHTPYPLKDAEVTDCEESLLNELGLKASNMPESVLFSEGVDVEIFRLKTINPSPSTAP